MKPTGRWFWLGAAGTLFYALGVGVTAVMMAREPAAVLSFAGTFVQTFTIVSAVLSWRITRDRGLSPRTRISWKWIATGLTVLSVSNLLYAYHWGFFPGPPEYLRFLTTPLLATGLLYLPRHNRSRRETLKVLLDCGTLAGATCAFLFYFQIYPALSTPRTSLGPIVAATMYPLSGLLLVFGLALVLLRSSDTATERPVRVFTLAAIPWLCGDFALSYRMPHLGSHDADGVQMLCFMTMTFLLAVAAGTQIRTARQSALPSGHSRIIKVSHLPYGGIAAIYAMLFFVAVREGSWLTWGPLVLCAFTVTALLTARKSSFSGRTIGWPSPTG